MLFLWIWLVFLIKAVECKMQNCQLMTGLDAIYLEQKLQLHMIFTLQQLVLYRCSSLAYSLQSVSVHIVLNSLAQTCHSPTWIGYLRAIFTLHSSSLFTTVTHCGYISLKQVQKWTTLHRAQWSESNWAPCSWWTRNHKLDNLKIVTKVET
jgi:hypothetical protein